MLEIINENTQIYQKQTKKSDRKKKGQFFTPLEVAIYMARMSKVRCEKMRILDCGAGTGILGLAMVKDLLDENSVNEIEVDFYENDEDIISLLQLNINKAIEYSKEKNKVLKCNIIAENFIAYNKEIWKNKDFNGIYDIAISNPPYKKLAKDSDESQVVDEIVFGQPNIYFIFMAMALHLLKCNGEMIFITPRSFTSGAYFKKFRIYLLEYSSIKTIHIFNSRNDVFKGEEVLQEAIITRCVKNREKDIVEIATTDGCDFHNKTSVIIPYDTMLNVDCDNKFILIPSKIEDVEILNTVKTWNENLIKLGYKLKTGPVVDFRAKDLLVNETDGTVPLIWSDNFIDNYIERLDNTENYRYIKLTDKSKGLLVGNKDYLLIKRFTAKEEKRRVQVALYLKDRFDECKYLGIENHVNYISTTDNIDKTELYGLFCLFNSTLIDRYYRIINGNTQVNATEINAMPLPSRECIKVIGKMLIGTENLTTEKCDEIIRYKVLGDK